MTQGKATLSFCHKTHQRTLCVQEWRKVLGVLSHTSSPPPLGRKSSTKWSKLRRVQLASQELGFTSRQDLLRD